MIVAALVAPEELDRALHSVGQITARVGFKRESVTATIEELGNCVPQSARFEGNHWRARHHELLLHNAARLEGGRHEPEIGSQIHQRTVQEERVRIRPKITREPTGQFPHANRTVLRVLLAGIGGSPDQNLNAACMPSQQLLGDVQDQVDALLERDATDKRNQNRISVRI